MRGKGFEPSKGLTHRMAYVTTLSPAHLTRLCYPRMDVSEGGGLGNRSCRTPASRNKNQRHFKNFYSIPFICRLIHAILVQVKICSNLLECILRITCHFAANIPFNRKLVKIL